MSSAAPRRGRLLAFLALLLAAHAAGCGGSKTVLLERRVTVRTMPPGGEVFEVAGGSARLLGREPVVVVLSATARGTRRFDASCFLYNPALILLFPLAPLLPEAYDDEVAWDSAEEARRAGPRVLTAALGGLRGEAKIEALRLPDEYDRLVETHREVDLVIPLR